jgi:tetratricopeptide (TPR) repeat protein
MDENRLEAYLDIIQKLLTCTDGEEFQILEQNVDFVDAGLVQVMVQVAEKMASSGEANASWLQNFAAQLAEALSNSSSTATTEEEYLDFLIQVVQATEDSNGDVRVVYPLLQANLDKLDMGFADVLKNWGMSTLPNLAPETVQGVAIIFFNFSKLIQDFPQGNRVNNIEIAIAGYEVVATVFTHTSFPENWAATQLNLGNAYRERIRGERAENLELAIQYCQAALEEITRSRFPQDWAATQVYLGNAYNQRIRGERAENLELAIQYYQAALEEYTRSRFPQDWAMIQNNLGNAYRERIRGERAENLELAIQF